MTGSIDKIAWIRIENGRVLSARSKGKELFYFPGGKRDPGETDTDTLLREIQEELSVRVQPDTVRHFGTFEAQADGKPAGVMVKMTCYTGDYEGELLAASEIDELAWLSYGERERTSVVTRIIMEKLHELGLLME
ncbi:NUDIX hydrolase [Gorillibacterium sp. sgz5001074]|uniref:NUDIX hydrolase n=1 Tax=Gorillibacterium sp. sgz5001074 TaxID=3446695 RepID=UPI003F6789C2